METDNNNYENNEQNNQNNDESREYLNGNNEYNIQEHGAENNKNGDNKMEKIIVTVCDESGSMFKNEFNHYVFRILPGEETFTVSTPDFLMEDESQQATSDEDNVTIDDDEIHWDDKRLGWYDKNE